VSKNRTSSAFQYQPLVIQDVLNDVIKLERSRREGLESNTVRWEHQPGVIGDTPQGSKGSAHGESVIAGNLLPTLAGLASSRLAFDMWRRSLATLNTATPRPTLENAIPSPRLQGHALGLVTDDQFSNTLNVVCPRQYLFAIPWRTLQTVIPRHVSTDPLSSGLPSKPAGSRGTAMGSKNQCPLCYDLNSRSVRLRTSSWEILCYDLVAYYGKAENSLRTSDRYVRH